MYLLNTLIFLPVICVVLGAIVRWKDGVKELTVVTSIIMTVISFTLLFNLLHLPSHFLGNNREWIGLDIWGAIIVVLVCFVNLTASIFSMGYMHFKNTRERRRYYLNYNLFVFSMIIVPILQEPNLVWIAVELTTLFSVLLVGFEYNHEALEAAWKYVVITLMGAGIALLGFLFLFAAAHGKGVEPYTWRGLQERACDLSPLFLKISFFFVLIGLGTKVGFVPMHTWLPDAHSQAPSPVCALLSGVETSVVLYVIIKFFPILALATHGNIGRWTLPFGLISTGIAALLIIQVKDFKRLFAFSTVEHMGIILVGFSFMGTMAYTGAMLQTIAHALTKSLCFYGAGALLYMFHTRDIDSIKDVIGVSPFISFFVLLGALAIAGAPPLVVFFTEFSIIKIGIIKHHYIDIFILCIFIVIAFFGIMNHVGNIVFMQNKECKQNNVDSKLPISCKIAIIMSAIPVIIFGIFPSLIYNIAKIAAITFGG